MLVVDGEDNSCCAVWGSEEDCAVSPSPTYPLAYLHAHYRPQSVGMCDGRPVEHVSMCVGKLCCLHAVIFTNGRPVLLEHQPPSEPVLLGVCASIR